MDREADKLVVAENHKFSGKTEPLGARWMSEARDYMRSGDAMTTKRMIGKLYKASEDVADQSEEGLRHPDAIDRVLCIPFYPAEFGDLISGIGDNDELVVGDWQQNTTYQGGYHSEHIIVKAFWIVIRDRFSTKERSSLLRFVHGSCRAPVRGFASLLGADGMHHKFTLSKSVFMGTQLEVRDAYPRAQSCFNTLYLPAYDSIEEVERRLRAVISENVVGFDEAAVAG